MKYVLWNRLNNLRLQMLAMRLPVWAINLASRVCVRMWRDSYAE